MSRTREINGWIYRSQADHKRIEFSTTQDVMSGVNERIKAKLIIELPERKVTISEDDLDKAFNSIRYLERHEDALCPYTVKWLKDAIFKDA